MLAGLLGAGPLSGGRERDAHTTYRLIRAFANPFDSRMWRRKIPFSLLLDSAQIDADVKFCEFARVSLGLGRLIIWVL